MAEPRVHLGSYCEIDICTFEQSEVGEPASDSAWEPNIRDATWHVAPFANPHFGCGIPEQYVYEVLVFDLERNRRLVAAVEIVSPANKDRPESRQMFVVKCLNLLRQGVCLSIVDLVTIRQFNLYTELLAIWLSETQTIMLDLEASYEETCRVLRVS